MPADVLPLTLMALWMRHKRECRAVGSIIAEARAGRLPGVELSGFSFAVKNERVALDAMRKS